MDTCSVLFRDVISIFTEGSDQWEKRRTKYGLCEADQSEARSMNIKKGRCGVRLSLFEVIVMNCFGKYTDSTESLIRKEEEEEVDDVSEVIDLSDMEIREEDEVGEEMKEEEVKLLTDEEVRAIAEEVDKREEESEKKAKERPDFLYRLLEHCIKTILLEEMTLVGQKMNTFRRVLAEGVLKLAETEEAENNRVKLDRFVDSFRAAWKEWKKKEHEESVVNVFMKEMDNELWHPER